MTLASKSKDWARCRGGISARTSGSERDKNSGKWARTSSTLINVLFTESITESGTTELSLTPTSIFSLSQEPLSKSTMQRI